MLLSVACAIPIPKGPSNPCFFVNPEKSKGSSLRGNPKILGKESKMHKKKQGKSENDKKQGKRKKARIGGSGYKGPKIEKFQSRLKFSISIENFNPDLQNSPQKKGFDGWLA